MKEHQNNILKNNRYKNYILGLLLIIALLAIFIDLKFFQTYLSKNYQKQNKQKADIVYLEEKSQISKVVPLSEALDHIDPKENIDNKEGGEESKDKELISELKNDDKADILALILDFIHDKDGSEKISSLRNRFLECPPEINQAFDFLDDYNKKFIVNNINPSIIIFPSKNNFLEKIFSPLVKVGN